MRLRRLIHGMGFRYRLHVKNLPGTPDLVFPSRKAVIFMHGCFWHRHQDCRLARMPKSRVVFWREKLESNKRRDEENMRQLHELGYQSVEERLILRRGHKVAIVPCLSVVPSQNDHHGTIRSISHIRQPNDQYKQAQVANSGNKQCCRGIGPAPGAAKTKQGPHSVMELYNIIEPL